MFDVFISYRRKSGSEFASFLTSKLKELGYEVFFDANSLREGDFEERIDEAIDQCTFFLLLLAPDDLDNSILNPEKDWIVHEARRALERGKVIIPVAIKAGFEFPEDCSEPTIEAVSKNNICYLCGTDAAKLVETELLSFMNDSPAKRLADEYNRGIVSPDYLAWELETLKGIYNDIPFVKEFGREYPVTFEEGSEMIKYPFDSLTFPKDQRLSYDDNELEYKDNPYFNDFKKIVGPHVHFPDLLGYTSNGFDFDEENKISGIKAIPRSYKETVFTCHILQYELWEAYKKTKGERSATLEDLPARKAIHKGKSNREVIFSGCNRSALHHVGMAVIDYNARIEEYGIASSVRTEDVATFPGYFSFVPSGGFELYELEKNQNDAVILENFTVISAVYREYIEEIFGDERFGKPTGDDDLNRLYRNSKIKRLREGVRKGTYKFEFLGVTFDIVTLMQTLAFVLRIDDEEFFYENEIRRNDENVYVKFEPLKNLDEMISKNNAPVMVESAAIYSLLKNNHLYKEIVANDFKLIE